MQMCLFLSNSKVSADSQWTTLNKVLSPDPISIARKGIFGCVPARPGSRESHLIAETKNGSR